MAFSDLQFKLGPWSSGGAPPPGPLVLDGALIGSDNVTALWNSTLNVKTIAVIEPRVLLNGNRIVVEGKTSILHVDQVPVEIVLEDAGQQLKVRLTATLPETWTFGQSFPDLPESFNFDPANYGLGESYLQSLAFSKPVFVVSTHDYRDAGSGVSIEKGLNFRAQMAPSGPLRGLEFLTGSKDAVLINGLVSSETPDPEFCLSASIPLRLGDSPIAKKIQNVRLKLWSSLSSASSSLPRIEVSLELELFANKTVEVYCPLRIGEPVDFIVIGGRFTNLDLPALGDIAQLVGGSDLQGKLPEELRGFGGLSITDVRTGIALDVPAIQYVIISVRTTTPWIVVSKIFQIDSIFVTWLIESPFDSDARRIACDIEGTLRIGDVPFELYAHFPDFQMTAAIADGNTIRVGALLKHLNPNSPLPEDSLVISTLALSLNPTSKSYAVDARIDNLWSIPLGSAQIDIASLALSLTKTADQLTGSFQGIIALHLPIDGAENVVIVTLTANLPNAPDAGWEFSGSTGKGQKIPIGALIKTLASMCGEFALPAPVEKFTVEDLQVSFNTKTGKFTFGCLGKLPLLEGRPPVEAEVDIVIDQEKKERRFGGRLTVYPAKDQRLDFLLKFESDPQAQIFLAAYYEEGGRKISIDDLISQVFDSPITTGIELTLKDALFAYRGDGAGSRFVFGLDIGIDIGLAKLPVVGPALPADLQVGVENLQILAATAPFSLADVTALNKLAPAKIKKLPTSKPDQGDIALKQGINLSAVLKLGGTSKLLTMPAGADKTATSIDAPGAPPGASTTPAKTEKAKAPGGISKWFDIQKNLGPLRLQRIGVSFKDQRLGFLFDAGLELLGVRLDLLGLSINLPLKNPQDVGFDLEGLELSIKQKPLEITGALLKVSPTDPDITLQYDGRVLVRAQVFSLVALGSYAVIKGQPSLFIFAVLHKELGGPPFFFVTGLAFGFGVNRLLKLPGIAEVHNFPLIKGATDPEYFGSAATPRTALEKLQEYVPPSVGNYWLAAGVKFESFGMIQSFAVLSVSFGTQFQIAILGLARISIPRPLPGIPPVDPIACAELAIKVSFTLSTGLLAAEARLTENSFVFSKDCKLRGGFALYCWFGPEHAGDFVVTLGGYHPKFLPPSHYPLVPRLGLSWAIGENLAIGGELYFALTPSCLMVGGKLCAVYQAGDLSAWFIARADFLINWQPFFYDIAMEVRIGVALRLSFLGLNQSLSIELGAGLELWGPPFGGIAHVTWYIISFDISFGEPRRERLEKVDWKTFQQSFLPQTRESDADPLLGSIRITGGLIKAQEITRAGKKTTVNVVNAHELSFTTESVVPATSVLLNNQAVADTSIPARQVGIRPMDIKALTSVHAVTFESKGRAANAWTKYVVPALVARSVPDALWSDKGLTRLERPAADMIESAPNGVNVTLQHREPSHGLAPIDLKNFKYDVIPKDIAWQEWRSPHPIPAPGDKTIANTISGNPSVDATRNSILKALGKGTMKLDLSNLASSASEIFQSEPGLARPGELFR